MECIEFNNASIKTEHYLDLPQTGPFVRPIFLILTGLILDIHSSQLFYVTNE